MSQILLVEGNNDLHVFVNIFEKHNIEESFEIENKKNIEGVLGSIPVYTKSDYSILGIVVDADFDIAKRWKSIKKILEKQGYTVPENPSENGTNLKGNDFLPDVGIWIMPNNKDKGMLEDFMKHLIPDNDLLLPEVKNVLSLLEKNELNKYKSIHKSKAEIHTWLAWQKDPGTPMGLAITKNYFENADLCNKFINWIKTTYKLTEITSNVEIA